MNKSILNHLFLPHYLPLSADDDFLIHGNHENEYQILECMKEYLNSFQLTDATNMLPIFRNLTDCVERWSILQNFKNISVSNIQSTVEQLPAGSFLPLYFHAQNAAILIVIDEKNSKESLISAWEVLLPISEITSSLKPYFSCFPVTTYRLSGRSQLNSKANCELLMDFMKNTIEYSKDSKSSHEIDVKWEVPQSHYVCQWWIQQFQGITIENNLHTACQFKKKHRDQIRWNNQSLPFRRSGLWMTIKVVFHTILTKCLRETGTVVYKLLITDFLTYIIETMQCSTDLLVYCIRKIVRRLNKIENLLLSSDSNEINHWIQHMKQKIKIKINQILPNPDWQKEIKIIEERNNQNLLMNNFQLDDIQIYKHSSAQLKAYLNNNNNNSNDASELFSDANNYDDSANVNQQDFIPLYNVLTQQMKYTIGIALTYIEIWSETRLEQWINRPSLFIRGKNCFEILLGFFEEYQNAALNYYWSENAPKDPIGYSRFILTSLTIIHSMHRNLCKDSRFKRLQFHSIQIPNLLDLFEFLILPTREDMLRARDLLNYFSEFNEKRYPDLLEEIESNDAFGVDFADQSITMKNSIAQIRAQAEQNKQQKIQEVQCAKQRYTQLMNSISGLPCSCVFDSGYRCLNKCKRCRIQNEANNIKVHIYECPLPSTHESALAVIFELQMPIEIRCYRDIIWQFINRPKPQPQNQMYEWLNVQPHASKLGPFYTGLKTCKVKLVSFTKSVTETSHPLSVAYASVEEFLHENSLQVKISPNQSIGFKHECRILTPQLDHSDYKQLQFTVDSTQFVQNRVIAKLSDCPPQVKPTQFVEFGSFRSGHHLQWWNLLAILETNSLSIAEESTAILIIHSILQYGPLPETLDTLLTPWCPDSHQQLLEDHFVDEIIPRLNRHLEDCELNWQNELVLIVITMITMRVLTICNSTKEDEVANLAIRCRKVGEKWLDLISTNIQKISSSSLNEVETLRLKMVNVSISCLLTFSTHQDRINCLLASNEHVVSLLRAATTVHDNIILNKNRLSISLFMRNIMRFSERVLVMIQPTIAEFLERTSYQSLNEFAAIYWAPITSTGANGGKWKKKKKDLYDGCYDCQYGMRYISIDCIRGKFLVDGMTIGFLPENITSNELFLRVFGCHIFEVQAAESRNTYITKHSYHGDIRVRYEFRFNDQINHLTIYERHIQTNNIYQLVPYSCFEKEMPDTFISNHSHWWNEKDQTVDFRPVHFKDSNFINAKIYVLSAVTGCVTTTETENKQTLINQSSLFFQNLFLQYFIRLDDKLYVYMMRDNTSQTDAIIHIHLSRLGIAFQYNTRTNRITSREYSDMCIDEDQWLGTLTGLTSGLLLSPLSSNCHKLGFYPYRKLIMPFGEIHCTKTQSTDHQTVTIKASSSILFSHQYFVFILNDRLKILQSTDSPNGWLYLALLHAMTSHPLPDQYTGMTGMERAFQLLHSAGCWSYQPYNQLSLNILEQIASVSPKINCSSKDLTGAIRIDWNSNGIPYSMQHFGYYLITKELIHASQLFNFMYPSSFLNRNPQLFDGNIYNETLLKKIYWNYRDSYNPITRLSIEMETDILSINSAGPHIPTSEHCSHVTNYSAVRLVADLYRSGNVRLIDCSDQHWLPLSQWLTDQNQLQNIWISLLKKVDNIKREATQKNIDESECFERLLDFLHYIYGKNNNKQFYLQMLKTAMKAPNISLRSVTFPPFYSYQNIEEVSFKEERIHLGTHHTLAQRNKIIAEIVDCWRQNRDYNDTTNLITIYEVTAVNKLFKSWRSNKNLRSFLEAVQSLITSVPIEQFHTKVSYIPQQFTLELYKDHHQIQFKSTDKSIDEELLRNAHQKFHYPHPDHFTKLNESFQNNNRQNAFPHEIFPSINDQNNPLSEITNYFKNQLAESWNKFLSDREYLKENPSNEEIIELLNSFREQSAKFWNELVKSITLSNEQLFEIGLAIRITPATIIPFICQTIRNTEKSVSFVLTSDQCTLLGGAIVSWILEQQMERALHFTIHNQLEDFKKEISHTPHSNWIPSEHVLWLILELEMNITIRENQVKVARHMMQPNMTTDTSSVRNIVMQMNMGEGKTSVILPMLAVSLSSIDSSLVRIIVLKSLFPTNYQSLQYKLGGLLNRKVVPFVCRRDLNFNNKQINQIFDRLKQGLNNCDVILTSLEDILSFDLLTIDKCRREEFDVGHSMLAMQRWLKTYARDILDESDEILHVKYQLIYTMGSQQQVDGGAERWKTIQSVLELVKKHAAHISKCFSEEVSYKPFARQSSFPQFRLQSHQPYPLLCENIANDWINQKSYRLADKKIILSFILETNSSVENLVKFPPQDIQLFLIFRGLLSSQVLLVAFKKRYRVNYGVNSSLIFNRLMAVPFRAKDVAIDRTEFGHPDVALVLTHLTYYYSGLNDSQLTKCFKRLNEKESDPASIYNEWILYEGKDDIPTSISQWTGVNLKDYEQQTCYLFPTLRYNMLVVNYFLNHFVFPREAKQFPNKLVASAWDLTSSYRLHIITGFSGTNDTQLLLPIHIRQYDLPELQKTDAIVVNNLLQPENESYQTLSIDTTSNEILKQIINYKESTQVILDVGALFIDGTNKEIAVMWLKLCDKNKIDYAVYFDSDSIVVCDRQYHHYPFVTSPASERLDRCVFYLDEIHTRGTDFKFPIGFRAVLTLGNGLTKDRFVQAAMRMRKLGNGHSLTFLSSNEVHQQITTVKKHSSFENQEENVNDCISTINILRWVYENTRQSTWDGLHHWASQSLNFQRKVAAFQQIDWKNHHQTFTDAMMKDLAKECLEPEVLELVRMYGTPRVLQTVFEIHSVRYQHINHYASTEIHKAVLKRLHDYGGSQKRLSQLLDDEQQRELEQELEEERQSARPLPVTPCEPVLHEEIKKLCDTDCAMLNLAELPAIFRPLTYAFTDTTLFNDCQPNSWQKELWISTEFQRVIVTMGETLNPFLRPPRWLIVYRNQHIIFVSAFEANWLIGRLNSLYHKQQSNNPSNTTLRLLLPRTKRQQSIFVNTPTLTIPPLIGFPNDATAFSISLEWLAQLFIFNGTLYFETTDEQTAYCQCLGLCAKPRTPIEEEAFEIGWIAADGFVANPVHRRHLKISRTRFNQSLLSFVKQVIENRNNSYTPISSHVGSIILKSYKLI